MKSSHAKSHAPAPSTRHASAKPAADRVAPSAEREVVTTTARVEPRTVATIAPVTEPVPAKVASVAFPERTAGFPKLAPRPSITVNGNVKTEKDGVKAEMTCAEIAALDKIPADRFARLDYHGVRKEGTATLTEPTQALHVEDGMEFVAVSR